MHVVRNQVSHEDFRDQRERTESRNRDVEHKRAAFPKLIISTELLTIAIVCSPFIVYLSLIDTLKHARYSTWLTFSER